MKHCMIDLETLDTTPSSVILSIGAVVFDPDLTFAPLDGERFYRSLHFQDQLAAGRTVSESTIFWWLDQSAGARSAIIDRDGAGYLSFMLDAFHTFYTENKCERVWANGLAFDVAIMDDAYRAYGRPAPWKYNHPREMRNLRDLYPDLITGEVAHHALDDALQQAIFVHKALRQQHDARRAGREDAVALLEQWYFPTMIELEYPTVMDNVRRSIITAIRQWPNEVAP